MAVLLFSQTHGSPGLGGWS